MAIISTQYGPIDETHLRKVLVMSDNPTDINVTLEYMLVSDIITATGGETVRAGVSVRRDAWIAVKRWNAEAKITAALLAS